MTHYGAFKLNKYFKAHPEHRNISGYYGVIFADDAPCGLMAILENWHAKGDVNAQAGCFTLSYRQGERYEALLEALA